MGKNIREINKQIKKELNKTKESSFNSEINNKTLETSEKVQVYNVSQNNNFDNNVIDMELDCTYIKENGKILKKVKERRY